MGFIISVLWLLAQLAIPFILLLIASGLFLFHIGRAETITAGINKVLDVVVKVWKGDSQPAPSVFTIESRVLDPLTQKLKVLGIFKVISLKGGWNNGHVITISHVASGTEIPKYMDVITDVFARFIRERYELPADHPVNVLGDYDSGSEILSLYCGLDDVGAAELDKMRQNKANQIMPVQDIIE